VGSKRSKGECHAAVRRGVSRLWIPNETSLPFRRFPGQRSADSGRRSWFEVRRSAANRLGRQQGSISDQVLRAFKSAGLVVLEGGRFELSLRSFDDLCRGYALADEARTNPARLLSRNQAEWRSNVSTPNIHLFSSGVS
jgi:hypothetical protein